MVGPSVGLFLLFGGFLITKDKVAAKPWFLRVVSPNSRAGLQCLFRSLCTWCGSTGPRHSVGSFVHWYDEGVVQRMAVPQGYLTLALCAWHRW